MYARAVEEAAANLRELRREEWEDFGLAAVALILALAAAEAHQALAVPLFLGGLFVGGLGVRALWRRWDLVDRLMAEPDAYSIAEVFDHASRKATLDQRRVYADLIRYALGDRSPDDARIAQVADELDALARELDDRELSLQPAAAVACGQLVSNSAENALLDPAVPAEDLRASICRIRLGFAASRATGPGGPRGDEDRNGDDSVPGGPASGEEIVWNGWC